MKTKEKKQLSKQFRPYIGPQYMEINTSKPWQGFTSKEPVFIFDFFAIDSSLQYMLSTHACELCGYKPTSLDIAYIDGQDKILKDEALSFWFWDDNGMIPFACIGGEAHKGPFSSYKGVLFLNANYEDDFSKMPVVLLSIEEKELTQVAATFQDLKRITVPSDRAASEEAKQKGNALFGTGDFEEAATHFFEAMRIDPTNPLPYNNMGMITQATNTELERGEFFAQLSFLVAPEFADGMRFYSGFLASKGKFKKAIKLMKSCLSIEESGWNYSAIAQYYLVSDQKKKGKKMIEKGLALEPDHPQLLALME